MRLPALALTATLATALAAGSARAASTPPNPCALVVPKDTTVLLGQTPAAAKPKTEGAARSCSYTSGKETLTLSTREFPSLATFSAEAAKLAAPVVPIAGIANAYSADGNREVVIWKDGVELIFAFKGFNPVFFNLLSLLNTALRGV